MFGDSRFFAGLKTVTASSAGADGFSQEMLSGDYQEQRLGLPDLNVGVFVILRASNVMAST
jgi:hypothetical protein